ncbi:hypothetical protein AB3M93_18775 [Novosphingobium panipatense]|uniref:hypothetical protein n=1 Tax=Novosphingobium panipatense TaxID=428991 RepID=UPI0039A12189
MEGQDYGGNLLVYRLMHLASAAEALGIAVVMLDVLDFGDPEKVAKRLALYTGYASSRWRPIACVFSCLWRRFGVSPISGQGADLDAEVNG